MIILAKEFAKNLEPVADLNEFIKALKKLTEYLGYERPQPCSKGNARNWCSKKQVLTGDGKFELITTCDWDGTFEPQLVKKYQTRITAMDNQILSLHAKG